MVELVTADVQAATVELATADVQVATQLLAMMATAQPASVAPTAQLRRAAAPPLLPSLLRGAPFQTLAASRRSSRAPVAATAPFTGEGGSFLWSVCVRGKGWVFFATIEHFQKLIDGTTVFVFHQRCAVNGFDRKAPPGLGDRYSMRGLIVLRERSFGPQLPPVERPVGSGGLKYGLCNILKLVH